MDPPDLGIFLHVQVSCARLQRHGPTRGGAGAHLAGSHHRDARGGLEEQGLTSLDLGEVKPLWTLPVLCHPSLEPRRLMADGSATSGTSSMTGAVTHDPVWKQIKGRRREREQREGARGLPRTRIGGGIACVALCSARPPPSFGEREREREGRGQRNWEIGRVRPGERIRVGDFFHLRGVRGRRAPLCAPFFSSPLSDT